MSVQIKSLSKCPDLGFVVLQACPKGFPIKPHYLLTQHKVVMADSDSILDCQRCAKSLLCSCSIQVDLEIWGH